MEVSVIIPSYNEAEDIGECLKSLKRQSFKDFEIIVVDDGSTDNTIEIVKNTAHNEDLNVKILRQDHQGPGNARNYGANNARGKILVLIDSDMTFDKDYIKNLIAPIKKSHEIIGTTHDYEIAMNTDNWISNLWGKIRVSKENANEVKIFRAIRKDKFLELGGFDQKYGYADDQTFWYKYRIKPIVAENTICYHINPETLKGTYKQARWIGASWKEKFAVFRIPIVNYLAVIAFLLLLPLVIAAKSLKTKLSSRISIIKIIRYYSEKFFGYFVGVFRAVYLNRVWK